MCHNSQPHLLLSFTRFFASHRIKQLKLPFYLKCLFDQIGTQRSQNALPSCICLSTLRWFCLLYITQNPLFYSTIVVYTEIYHIMVPSHLSIVHKVNDAIWKFKQTNSNMIGFCSSKFACEAVNRKVEIQQFAHKMSL